jgi:hypothetical protein
VSGLSFGGSVCRAAMRARVGAALAACLLAWSLSPPAAAAAAAHGVDGVNLRLSLGFVQGSAWFEDRGPGRSGVHVWIDTYSAATGLMTASLGHRTGVNACDVGATCYVHLSTSVQSMPGECYVLRALSGRGADLITARAPARDLLCG